MRSKACLLNIA
uniref:Uncharacterized protein n=1 Tax=Anguilla anguilla TaxID=7936 RepID=A0A0E9QNR6_ANGAN